MSEIKPDVNKKVNQLREMDARDRWRLIGNWLLDHAMIIIILLMVIYIQIQRPAFLATASIVNIIQLTATRLPIALGIAGAIILTGTDLSAGRVVGLGAFVSAILLQKSDLANRFLAGMGPWPVVIVLVVVMAVGGIVGLVNGFCVAKFKLHPFIVTLSTQLITYGLYLTLSNAAQISNLDESYTSNLVIKPMFRLGNTPVMSYVAFAIIVTAIMWFIWNKTTFGKNMFAVGSNPEAAKVSGVNVMKTTILVHTLAGAMYGLTGFIESSRIGSNTANTGLNYECDAIAACVIGGVSFVGGTGKISGVVLGVFLLRIIFVALNFLSINMNMQYVIKGLIILVACAIDMRKYLVRK